MPATDIAAAPPRGTWRTRRRPRDAWLTAPWFAAIAAAVAFAIVANGPDASGTHRMGGIDPDSLAVQLGFGIDQVSVSGHRFTTDSDILDAIDLANVRSQWALDQAAVRARIERLPWVASASIERELPDRLRVVITERRPFAIVHGDGNLEWLIDRTGRRLGPNPVASPFALPRLRGAGATEDASALLDTLALFPDLAPRLEFAERVGARRWRLHLLGSVRIELPAIGLEAALSRLIEGEKGRRLIDLDVAMIDLRSHRFAVVRPRPDAVLGSVPAKKLAARQP